MPSGRELSWIFRALTPDDAHAGVALRNRLARPSADAEGLASDRGACALLVTEDDRYLLQLRDAHPGMTHPGYWGFFGGNIEPGELPEVALRRELIEELRFEPRQVDYLTEVGIVYPGPPRRLHSVIFFIVRIAEDDLGRMTLGEGRGMKLFSPEELESTARVDPLGLAVLMMHARPRDFYRP
jgi:8-oxo-dGTP pyrophosphatase MutT (NUDIX family)